jgi:hypothetical protein
VSKSSLIGLTVTVLQPPYAKQMHVKIASNATKVTMLQTHHIHLPHSAILLSFRMATLNGKMQDLLLAVTQLLCRIFLDLLTALKLVTSGQPELLTLIQINQDSDQLVKKLDP